MNSENTHASIIEHLQKTHSLCTKVLYLSVAVYFSSGLLMAASSLIMGTSDNPLSLIFSIVRDLSMLTGSMSLCIGFLAACEMAMKKLNIQ
jgi:hypothetical protein